MTSTAGSSTKPPVPSFEFTKRKRWIDTLFSEISDTLLLIVSPSFKVLYCGSAVVELLGWKEDQLIDADLSAFIEEEDVGNFVWSFTEAFRLGHELFTYARFKHEQVSSSANHSMLFEIKGHPHCFEGEDSPQCFFLSAMPFPSRDIALLNSFLDLKIENEWLSKRIQAYTSTPESAYEATEHLLPQYTMGGYSQRYPQGCGLDASRLGVALPISGTNEYYIGEDDSDDARRRKKLKKISFGDEQHVCITCGRTDSPEWRKGPHGPKTLCNACGLRWAKRTRKDETERNISRNDEVSDNLNSSNVESSTTLPLGGNQGLAL